MSSSSQPAVVCDTTAYLPDEIVDELGIHRVSLYVTLDGDTQPEAELSDYDTFYDRLSRSQEGASTSQPSVGDFISVYEPLLADGRDVISIHLSAGISGTCDSANQARQKLIDDGKGGERVRVYDSRSACGGTGLLAIAAAKIAAAGGDADSAMQRVEETRDALKMWFAIDTLEYLRKGGRIGAAQAFLGSTLKIKPILTLEEEITPIERVRTRRRALERMVDFARSRHEDGADGWVVQHIHDPETAQTLLEHGRDVYGCEPVFVSEIGPVIGAHIGPGLLGIGGVPKSLLEA